MAVRVMDGFDHGNVGYMAGAGFGLYTGQYSLNQNDIFGGHYDAGYSIGQGGNNGSNAFLIPLDLQTTWIVGCGFYQRGAYSTQNMINIMDGYSYGNDTSHVSLWKYDGGFQIQLGGTGTGYGGYTWGPSASNVWQLGQWYYIEIKTVIAPSAGYVEVRLNGQTIITYSGQTQYSTTAGARAFVFQASGYGGAAGPAAFLDNVYILDGNGSPYNDFLGPARVDTCFARSDGDVLDWTPNTGTTQYNVINEVGPDSDTTYISDSTSGHKSVFNYRAGASGTTAAIQISDYSEIVNSSVGLVQTTGNCNLSSITSTGSVTAGNCIVVVAGILSGSCTISDSLGSTYTLLQSGTNSTTQLMIYAAIAPASGTCTVTLGGTFTSPALIFHEFTGVSSPLTLDAHTTAVANQSSPLTTTQADTLIIAAISGQYGYGYVSLSIPYNAVTFYTTTTNVRSVDWGGASHDMGAAFGIAGVAQTYNTQLLLSNTNAGVSCTAAIKTQHALSVQPVLKQSTTTSLVGSPGTLLSTYQYNRNITSINPFTGTQWKQNDLELLEVGVQIV